MDQGVEQRLNSRCCLPRSGGGRTLVPDEQYAARIKVKIKFRS